MPKKKKVSKMSRRLPLTKRHLKLFLFFVTSVAAISLLVLFVTLRYYSIRTPIPGVSTTIDKTIPPITNPLMIDQMKKRSYPASVIVTEHILPPGSNYEQYIVSYTSDGNKIYALMTIPFGEKPKGGWPVIVFNHGYIPPKDYVTTQRYGAYVDAFAKNGYIVFKSDYRGHGKSEGMANAGYYAPDYAIDVLNAVSSLKRYKDANPEKIGMWGHSMGGNITLRAMVVSKDIKAGVIWGGVVGNYSDLTHRWRRPGAKSDLSTDDTKRVGIINEIVLKLYGDPDSASVFWQAIDPYYHLNNISAPIQLHHGIQDDVVPLLFSQHLASALKNAHKSVELFTYNGETHNIDGPSFSIAMERSIAFFNRYLK